MSMGYPPVSCDTQQADAISYVSFDEIRHEMRRWPLSIEFSERIDNNDYLISGVHLLIIDSSDNIIFDEVIGAPFFVALLQPGNYQLIASYDEVKISQKFEIIVEIYLLLNRIITFHLVLKGFIIYMMFLVVLNAVDTLIKSYIS